MSQLGEEKRSKCLSSTASTKKPKKFQEENWLWLLNDLHLYSVYVILKSMRNWDDVKKELLKDPETRAEYERLKPRFKVISLLIGLRLEYGLTQKQLAEKVGTKQSAIARLESGSVNPSIDFLDKVVSAMGKRLVIQAE